MSPLLVVASLTLSQVTAIVLSAEEANWGRTAGAAVAAAMSSGRISMSGVVVPVG